MKKITDRYWLGIISGIGGNLAKNLLESIFVKRGLLKITARQKAAGIFVNKSDIDTPGGRLLGIVADNMIAAMLGITCTYWLTLMGKDKHLLKGAGLGAVEWASLYGVASKVGATSMVPMKPQDALFALLGHFAFGMVKIHIATTLGDSRLFQPAHLSLQIEEPESFKWMPRPLQDYSMPNNLIEKLETKSSNKVPSHSGLN